MRERPLHGAGDVAGAVAETIPERDGFRPLARHDFTSPQGRRLRIYGELRGRAASLPAVQPAALHQRYDALTDTWIAVSPSRNVRPNTTVDDGTSPSLPAPCPLCPGGPEVAFSYEAAVFENRWPSFLPDPPAPPTVPGSGPGDVAPSIGRCEVVLYTEHHTGSIATLSPDELARVVAVWRDRTGELWADERLRFVMAFENRGEAVGATISHPHGQIYAFDRQPPFIAARAAALARHRAATGACLACEVAGRDAAGPRVVVDNASFVVAVPFAPHWPYEIHVRARRHGLRRLADLASAEQRDLASALRAVVLRYDGLFGFELPYMMVALEAPADAPDHHLAFEFLPPHRNERLTKVRASVETATGLFINDTLPEASATRLAGIAVPPRDEAEPLRVDVVEHLETGS